MSRPFKKILHINGEQSQKCGRCREVKSISEFFESRLKPTGFDYYCKICRNSFTNTHRKGLTNRMKNRRKKCDDCGSDCDGTLVINALVRCSVCFDKIIYGENPTQWSLPQRSAMLL